MVYQTYESYREAWTQSSLVDPPIPLNVDIELASLCNLTCPFCFISDGSFDEMIKQKDEDGKSRRRLMPKKMAFKIIEQAAELGVPALKFNWRGESTLHPDYSEILKYSSNQFSVKCGHAGSPHKGREWVNNKLGSGISDLAGAFADMRPMFHELLVNTNANCSKKALPGLMAATKVMVSLDSMDHNTYKIMRRGGDLQKAKEVIWNLVMQGHKNVWVRRVMTKDNEHEDFYGDVRKEWGDQVHISEHYCFDRNEAESHEVVTENHDSRQYCGYPSVRLVVAASGMVYPCCIDLHQEMPLGDINKESLKDIWNGDKIKVLRKELREGTFQSNICKNCQSWMAYKSPKREFVQDKHARTP